MAKRRLKTPDKTALVFDGEQMTYRQLADGADRVSALLARRGIGKGDSVAYLGENSPAFLQVLFGVVQLGAVFVPVNTRLAPPEITHVLTDCRARALIHDPEFSDRVAPGAAAGRIAHVIVTGEGSDGHPGLDRLARDAAGGHTDAEVALEDPAAIIYTSGTTGKPKGAVLTHQNLTWVAINCLVDYDVVSTDVALMISPLFHVASLGMGALPVILKGATLVLEKGFEPGRALAQIERHGVTMLSGVPTTYQLLADHPDWARTDLSTLSKLTCGGSAVPTRILNEYEERGLSFSQGYGMTETSPGATSLSPAMTRAKQGSVGLAALLHRRAHRGRARRHGSARHRGGDRDLGPQRLPRLSRPARRDRGCVHERRLVPQRRPRLPRRRRLPLHRRSAEGHDHLGRREHLPGRSREPAQRHRRRHRRRGDRRARREVGRGALGRAHGARGRGRLLDDVRAHLDGRIARYKIPKNVVVIDELPRTASGKVRKADLRARFGS